MSPQDKHCNACDQDNKKALRRMTIIRNAFKDGPHPWYGDCDGCGPNGSCAECIASLSLHKPFFWMWLDELLKNE